MKTFYFLIFLIPAKITSAQLSKCTDPGSCPTAGVWGEWKNVGNAACDLSCGGCGKILQSRECVGSPICNCTGPTTRTIGCNFDGCKYPSQKTCCAPYLPMIINGVIMCGPIPKPLDSNACCPQQSLLTQWTAWAYVSSQWIRSRKCLSASIGCPCSEALTETKTDVNEVTCTANLVMLAEIQPGKIYCKALTDTIYKDEFGAGMGYAGSLLIMDEVSGECTTDVPFDCNQGANAQRRQNASFTCDTKTGKWIYDYTGRQVNGVVIGSWN